MKDYRYKTGKSYKIDANVVGQELERIMDKFGIIRPKDIINEAKNKRAKLHNCFEWNDTVAGHNYRVWEARQLATSLIVTIEKGKEEEPAFINVTIDENTRGYLSGEIVFKNISFAEQAIQDVFDALTYFKNKYNLYKKYLGKRDRDKLRKKIKNLQNDI